MSIDISGFLRPLRRIVSDCVRKPTEPAALCFFRLNSIGSNFCANSVEASPYVPHHAHRRLYALPGGVATTDCVEGEPLSFTVDWRSAPLEDMRFPTVPITSCAGQRPDITQLIRGVPESGHCGTITAFDGPQFRHYGRTKKKFFRVGAIAERFRWEWTPKELKFWLHAKPVFGCDAIICPSRDGEQLTAKVAKML